MRFSSLFTSLLSLFVSHLGSLSQSHSLTVDFMVFWFLHFSVSPSIISQGLRGRGCVVAVSVGAGFLQSLDLFVVTSRSFIIVY